MKRVFIVEDSDIVRRWITEDIDAMNDGVEVVGFADSQAEAIASIERLRPDVVVTDLQLREGSGFRVVQHIASSNLQPRPRIIVLSNYAFPEYRKDCLALGAHEFLDKASGYACLVSAIHNAG